jgi:hypothetical protein
MQLLLQGQVLAAAVAALPSPTTQRRPRTHWGKAICLRAAPPTKLHQNTGEKLMLSVRRGKEL